MAVTQEVREHFLDQLGTTCASAYPRHLEQNFPHVFENIVRLWGTPQMESFFNNLLITQRTGRQGFSPEAADEILGLISAYHKLGLAIQPPKRNGDVWDWVSDIGYFEKEHRR